MVTQNDFGEQPSSSGTLALPPRLPLLTMFRLGLFQMGLGIMAVLTLGVLNRVMIDELQIPAFLATGAIAMHQFVAPARVWFGQLSDAKPLLGFHRTGYVWVGTALFTLMAFVAVQVIWELSRSMTAANLSSASYIWLGVLGLVFAGYGLALSSSSTPFAALLVDVSDEDDRSKLVSIVWSMLTVGIVLGAIISSLLLKPLEQDTPLSTVQLSINQLFLILPAVVLGLALIATFRVETCYSRYGHRSIPAKREDSITLRSALKILTASPQTGIFFTFLVVLTISLFMQEGVLEPYGGQVFGMTISETTRLNAYWGVGTLIGLGATGFLIVPHLGKRNTAKLGCLLSAGCFLLLILVGISREPGLLQYALLGFGLAAGITTNGAISLMLDLTAAETAGTFIGTWGLAQAISRAVATVTGGAILDLGKGVLGLFYGPNPVPETNLLPAYSLVFGLQAVGMVGAVVLLNRVNVQEFQETSKMAIAAVLEGELE